MKIVSVSPTDPILSQLRASYLDSLAEPQDMYSESLIRGAANYVLGKESEPVGHFAISDAGTLLEFHVIDERLAQPAFDKIFREHLVERALCKSSDSRLLAFCRLRAKCERPIAFLFTTVDDVSVPENAKFRVRAAQRADLYQIVAIDDGFFDTVGEILDHIENSRLLLYEEDQELIACGLLQPVIEGRIYRDLGMLVKPSRRRQGIGTHVIRHLKAACLDQGLRPICCCDIENTASRRCLQAAGFRSWHRIVEFAF